MAIRWGVLGAGSVAQRRVMPAMNALEDHAILALMVRDMDRAKVIAAEHDVANSYDSVEALIEDNSVDAIYVSSPVNLHLAHVKAVAGVGKHVLCEKPMGMTPNECREMMAACDSAGVHLQLCFVLRGWPIYHRVKALIDEGKFGQIVEIRAHLAKWTPREPGEWRLDPAQGGGGVLIDVGAHYLDLFRFLIGDFTQIVSLSSSQVFDWPVEESSFVTVGFENGAHGVMGLSCTIRHNGNVLEIYGTEGSLFLGSDLRIVTSEGEDVLPVEFPDYYSGLLTNFNDCISGKGEPLASGVDGLRNIEVIQAAYQSGREGRVIGLK
ncbi:MAG: Gfo/Idh/MocA family oxidoreductase [Candidatus Latescibacteria bacterium]|nr:Gfo/Idh/MocA family oxidoreductase [Candidatus Latescibacterota bacterium]